MCPINLDLKLRDYLFKDEEETLIYVEEKIEVIPLGHPDNPVDTTTKLLVYAGLNYTVLKV
jgi:hypothetical protein